MSNTHQFADMVPALVTIGVCLFFYFLPTVIASQRQHHQTMAIFVMNAFLGWTFIGWIGALIWSATAVRRGEYR